LPCVVWLLNRLFINFMVISRSQKVLMSANSVISGSRQYFAKKYKNKE